VEQFFQFLPLRLRQQPGAQVGRTDGVGFLQDERFAGVETGHSHRKGEAEHQGQ